MLLGKGEVALQLVDVCLDGKLIHKQNFQMKLEHFPLILYIELRVMGLLISTLLTEYNKDQT